MALAPVLPAGRSVRRTPVLAGRWQSWIAPTPQPWRTSEIAVLFALATELAIAVGAACAW